MMVNQIKHLRVVFLRTKAYLLAVPAIQLISRTAKGSGNHDATQRAAGVAYYSILSIFPLILGLIAVFGYFLPSINFQERLMTFVGGNLPGASDFMRQNIEGIVDLREAMGALSIVILFWSASAMFGSIVLAINRAWDISQFRPFFTRKAGELGMAIGVGMLFLLSLGASAVISITREVFDLSITKSIIVDLGSRVIAFLLILAVFLLLYKFIPNTRTYWSSIWPGALLAAVLFEIARTLFIFFLANFANYQLIYGSIASIIVLLIWIYYSAYIMIMGAEFTFQYSRMRLLLTTTTVGKGYKK
jgi:membrane protein